MKPLIVLLILVLFYSCNNTGNEKDSPKKVETIYQYDSVRFNNRLKLDTTKCHWVIKGREVIDSFYFEKAFFVDRVILYLHTIKHGTLFTCDNIPSFLKVPGDTFLVTGIVCRTYSADDGGRPSLLTEVAYSSKDR